MRVKTPEQRQRATDERMEKLAGEIEDLRRVLAAQNRAIASLRRQWAAWSEYLERTHEPGEGINAAAMLTTLIST